MMLTACEDTSDLGQMQVNPQPTVVESNGVTTTDILGTAVDLGKYENLNLPVADVAMSTEFPASAYIGGTLQVSTTADFAKHVDIEIFSESAEEAQNDDNKRHFKAEVEGNAWENAFVELFDSRDPAMKTMYYRYMLLIQDGTQSSILKYENDDFWPARQIEVTPVDLKLPVSTSYYVSGTYVTRKDMVRADGKHLYDDPTYSVVVEVSDAEAAVGYAFQIVDGVDNTKVYGPAADTEVVSSYSGRLSEGGQQLIIKTPGSWKIEANMYTKMCSVNPAFSTLYVPSSGNNWSFTRNCQQLPTSDYQIYEGAAFASKVFGLTSAPDMKHFIYGMGDKAGKLGILSSTLTVDNGIPTTDKKEDGLFWIKADVINLTYAVTPIQTLSLIGGFNDWNGDVQMSPVSKKVTNNQAYSVWKGDVTFDAPGEFKIRANNNWTLSFGTNKDRAADVDQFADVTYQNTDNFKVEEAGTYTVTISFQTLPYTVTMVKK